MLTIFGLLPGMNHVEKWWAIMSLIFIKLLIELPYYKKNYVSFNCIIS